MFLAGCQDSQKSVSENTTDYQKKLEQQIQDLKKENDELKQQSHKDQEKTLDSKTLRETLNISLRILSAQNNTDYEYLESVLSEEVKLDRDNNKFLVKNTDSTHEQKFISGINLENLEFRFIEMNNPESVTAGFAKVENEMNIEIYLEFKNIEGTWKLSDILTN